MMPVERRWQGIRRWSFILYKIEKCNKEKWLTRRRLNRILNSLRFDEDATVNINRLSASAEWSDKCCRRGSFIINEL
jgi:hypothetical protein